MTREQYDLARKIFAEARDTPTDINEHIETLREYASKCSHVTELGTRYGTSATALCMGCAKVLSYDLTISPGVHRVQAAFPGFEARLGNSLLIQIDETDLLFVDTLHRYEQVRVELGRHHSKVRKWIILHDTVSFGRIGDDGGVGINQAIAEFLEEHADDWRFKEQYTNCNGLTILERYSHETTSTL